jgi:hypothetical protein
MKGTWALAGPRPSDHGPHPSNRLNSGGSISSVPRADGPRWRPALGNFTPHASPPLRPPVTLTKSHRQSACPCDRRTGFTNAPRVETSFAGSGVPRKEGITHLASLSTPLPPAIQPDLLAPTPAAARTWPDFPRPALSSGGFRCSPQ